MKESLTTLALVMTVGLLMVVSPLMAEEKTHLPTSSPEITNASKGLKKGMTEWGILNSFGFSYDLGESNSDTELYALAGRWGYLLGETSKGPLKGNWEFGVEFLPATFLDIQSDNASGLGFTLFSLYNLTASKSFQPYLILGIGALFTNKKIPDDDTAEFNFTPQGGLGLRYFIGPQMSINIEYRFYHISNASTAESNPGLNLGLIELGFSVFR